MNATDNVKKEKKKNVYVTALVTRTLVALIGFVYTIFLARYLGTELRGRYSVILNYPTIIGSILTFGIPNAYPRFKRIHSEKERSEVYKSFIGNSMAMFWIVTILSLLIGFFVPMPEQYKWCCFVLPFTYMFKLTNTLALMEHSRFCNLTQMWLGVFDLFFVIVLMLFTEANLLLCYLFLIVDKAVYAIFSVWNLRATPKMLIPRFDKNIGSYIAYGFVPMLTGLLLILNNKMDVIMMDFFPNVTDSEIGIYSVGVMLAEKIWIIPDALTNILQSRLAAGKDIDEVCKVSRICILLTGLCVIGVAVLGKPLITIAYGEAYSNAYSTTLIVLLGVVFMVFFKIAYAYNVVVGKNIRNIIYLGITFVSNVIINCILIPIWGMYGAAVATLISFMVCGTIFLATFSNDAKVPFWKLIIVQKQDYKYLMDLIKRKSLKK